MEVSSSDNESTSGQSTSSSNKKLTNCEVCAIEEAKYTCPRCEVRTCSLNCSRIHKKELLCSGFRDCTKFIPIHKFSNIDLSSDYQFLEKISKDVQSYKKNHPYRRVYLPKNLWLNQKIAESCNTYLKYLPATFARHKQNSTHYNRSSKALKWHVEWIFPLESLKLQEKHVADDLKLGTILQKYFVKHEDPAVQEKLQYYQSAGLNQVQVYLKAEEKAGNLFYELDLDDTLRENLRNKVIIEYPVIHVVLKQHSSCYELVDENENLGQKGNDVVNDLLKNAESDESIYKSMKNLLFMSDEDLAEGGEVEP